MTTLTSVEADDAKALQEPVDTPTLDFPQSDDLAFLDVNRITDNHRKRLKDLRIAIIGGGPAGLLFARNTSRCGADVTVFEKSGDPRSSNQGYTDRSFNITLESVGRYVLDDPSIWRTGSRLIGRAIHNFQNTNEICYTQYGADPNEDLVSIPRPVLRQNMINSAEHEGAKIRFGTEVTELEPDTAVVSYVTSNGAIEQLAVDLIVVADGLHSIGDTYLQRIKGAELHLIPETLSCVSALLPSGHNLSSNHIHFWHEASSSYTIGIPNADGTTALLLVSTYDNLPSGERPFADPKLASERLKREFPHLYEQAPDITSRLQNQRIYKFYYKSTSRYMIGKRTILIGDAACVVPPWAGFGANSAMYAAASLAYQLGNHDDIEEALRTYERRQLVLSKHIMEFVLRQGVFLSTAVTDTPSGNSQQSLAPLIRLSLEQAQ